VNGTPVTAILGAGRMGQGLALALHVGGYRALLVPRTAHPLVPPLRAHEGGLAAALQEAALVVLAVPDGAITPMAATLAGNRSIQARHVVLHLSGLLHRAALTPLASTGAGLGSFHPLQTVSDPATAPERLAGAYAGIEGDERALSAAGRLAEVLGMIPVPVPPSAKPVYHAGAAFAANFTVALAGVATRLATAAGLPPQVAQRLYLPLIRGAAANLETGAPAALTGPIRRGDAETVLAHLKALGPADRELYLLLAREALRLARQAGLSEAEEARIARVLDQPIGDG
jgi:predicted short-subunit dehydrogenase-like oxidoreductase (DUF2520 family)